MEIRVRDGSVEAFQLAVPQIVIHLTLEFLHPRHDSVARGELEKSTN